MNGSTHVIRWCVVMACVLAWGDRLVLGDAPTEFELHGVGRTFRSTEARGRFVALHFLLKTDCPMCLRYLAEYVALGPTVAGVEHVFIKPDSDADFSAWVAKLPASVRSEVTVYRDPDAGLARAFAVPDGYRFHGETVHYPAMILLGPDGREAFRHVGRANTDRLAFSAFASKYAELTTAADAAEFNLGPDKLALSGYDAVSYFSGGSPRPGRPDLVSTWRGVTYQFATSANRAAFAADPAKFAPAYGGWCATAMADGRKVEVAPTNFKVTGNRLLLFYKGWHGDARRDWDRDEPNLTRKADQHWRRIAPLSETTRAARS